MMLQAGAAARCGAAAHVAHIVIGLCSGGASGEGARGVVEVLTGSGRAVAVILVGASVRCRVMMIWVESVGIMAMRGNGRLQCGSGGGAVRLRWGQAIGGLHAALVRWQRLW